MRLRGICLYLASFTFHLLKEPSCISLSPPQGDTGHGREDRPFRPASTRRGSSLPCRRQGAGVQALRGGAVPERGEPRQALQHGGNERISRGRRTRERAGGLFLETPGQS